MKKIITITMMVLLLSALAFAATYKDGVYFAQQPKFDERTGWKSTVTIVVKNGKITDVEWNAANLDGGTDKVTRSESGEYGMVAYGSAQAEWHVQAERAEEYLLQLQDPSKVKYSDNEGHIDAVSGVSIHVNDLFELAQEALKKGPVGYGPYKDGTYHAEEKQFGSTGWKYSVDITVVSGYIVSANWNGTHKEGGTDKKQRSKDGEYGMVKNGNAQWPWFEQAHAAEAYLIKTQDPKKIKYTDDEGHTDAIAGASIHVVEFFSLAEDALRRARR